MLLSLLAYMRFYMMMYEITFFSIMTVHAAFIRKFAELSFEDSPDDDDLVEPISPF